MVPAPARRGQHGSSRFAGLVRVVGGALARLVTARGSDTSSYDFVRPMAGVGAHDELCQRRFAMKVANLFERLAVSGYHSFAV